MSVEVDRLRCDAYWQSVHGSNALGCVDRDKQEMNTMSECQVKTVRGSEKSMMEALESMKEEERGGGTRIGGGIKGEARWERFKRTAYADSPGWENDLDGELESETKWSAGGGRWSQLNPCPEYCTNCGREADTIAERSPVASINKINWWGSPPTNIPFVFIAFQEDGMETYSGKTKRSPLLNIPSAPSETFSIASWMSGSIGSHCLIWVALACIRKKLFQFVSHVTENKLKRM